MKNPKKLLLLCFLLINCTMIIGNSSAQWISQYPTTIGVILRDIEFINRYTGWTIGDGGLILKTTNGGKNWVSQPNPATGKSLFSIHPVDSMVAYCVGLFQTILKTTNGGEEWIVIQNAPIGTGSSYYSCFFINENTGWVGSTHTFLAKIMKTTDGGKTFSDVIVNGIARDLYFKDSINGIGVGWSSNILTTTNGGLNWSTNFIAGSGDINKISILKDNHIAFVVSTTDIVYKTTNFGIDWDSIALVHGADRLYACYFVNELTGFVGGTYGEMFKTTNGGATWKMEDNNGDQRLVRSFWFYDELTGWAVGGSTKIFYTETGGLTNVEQISVNIPVGFYLYQNYPNPFNFKTTIRFDIPNTGFLKLEVFDALGKKINEIFNKDFSPGSYEVSYDAELLTSGIYFYKLSAPGFSSVKKFILLK